MDGPSAPRWREPPRRVAESVEPFPFGFEHRPDLPSRESRQRRPPLRLTAERQNTVRRGTGATGSGDSGDSEDHLRVVP